MNGVPVFLPISYLVASILFIVGLKRLSSPAEARSGNLVAAVGMALAVIATLMAPHLEHRGLMLIALAIGGIAGVVGARRVSDDRHAADGGAPQRTGRRRRRAS